MIGAALHMMEDTRPARCVVVCYSAALRCPSIVKCDIEMFRTNHYAFFRTFISFAAREVGVGGGSLAIIAQFAFPNPTLPVCLSRVLISFTGQLFDFAYTPRTEA